MKLSVRIHGLKKRKVIKIIYFIVFLLALGISLCGGSVVCLAWSAGGLKATIASIVLSMLLSSGTGVTNMDWLTQLNNAYGVESSIGTLENAINTGLLTEQSGVLIDTGLSEAIMNQSAYNSLGLGDLFATTADDIAIQAGTQVATGGANLATEAIGTLSIGTVGQAFVAIGAGIGLGVLAHHVIERFGKYITQGRYINSDTIIDEFVSDGEGYQFCDSSSSFDYLLSGNNLYPYYYINNATTIYGVLATNNTSYIYRSFYNGNVDNQFTRNLSKGYNYSQGINRNNVLSVCGRKFNSQAEFEQAANAFINGSPLPDIYSPDIIGKDGNVIGTYDNGYNVPSISPYYNPQNKGIRPINLDDYMDFARQADDLTEQDKVGEDQADNFKDFVDPYLQDQEPEIPEQDPDYTNPDQVPTQPDYNPKDPVTPEDIDTSDPYTTPDLMDKFPFCIPNDILAIFQKFKMAREAPKIEWNFQYDQIGLDETISIDFSEYDSAASLLRTLEVILFTVGLGVATRKLIGG